MLDFGLNILDFEDLELKNNEFHGLVSSKISPFWGYFWDFRPENRDLRPEMRIWSSNYHNLGPFRPKFDDVVP